jgi:hypothetical protein
MEATMPNAFDFKCPACGNEDQLDILASIWIRLTEDGTDPDARPTAITNGTNTAPSPTPLAAVLSQIWPTDPRGVCLPATVSAAST